MNTAKHARKILALGCASIALLSACNRAPGGLEYTDYGQATKVASPTASNPAGTVLSDLHTDDLLVSGTTLAVRQGTDVFLGTPEQFASNTQKQLTLSDECGVLSASDARPNTFLVACNEQTEGATRGVVYTIGEDAKAVQAFVDEQPLQSVVQTADGRVFAGDPGSTTVLMYADATGGERTQIQIDRPVDALVTSDNGVVAINNAQTVIQQIDWREKRPGAALRIGIGVAKTAPGAQNMVLATDSRAHIVSMYTIEPVLRLHQSVPVAEGPWAVAWDSQRQVAWISSTGTNTVSAYDFSTGVPVETYRINTDANINSIAADEGKLYVAGEQLRLVTPEEIEQGKLHHDK